MGTTQTSNSMMLKINKQTKIVDNAIEEMFEKTVTAFGTGAKIDCPKEHIGKQVYVIIRKKK